MSEPRMVMDGHSSLFGMDADTSPTALKPVFVAKAVNRIFRGGKNDPRPAFQQINLIFANDADKALFQGGNMQGMTSYLKKTPGRSDGIVVSIGGTIFYIVLVNESGYVNRIMDGNEKQALHCFFVQAEEWLYIQDGHNLPIFWNGIADATRSTGPDHKKMPIGTIMTYAHGRIFVSNEFNEIRASDVMFGNGFTDTTNVQNFTETEYWQEGGAFVIPSDYGQITGMVVLPSLSSNIRGQGELLAFAENGAMSFDVNLPRLSWKDAQIQKTALKGRGCLSPYSLITVNGDAWYKSADGWATYSNSSLDFAQRPSFRKFSAQINNWLDSETPDLRRYAAHVFFDNRILGTVQPSLSLTRYTDADENVYGSHRYFRGLVALDLDPTSGTRGGDVINFDGLWTGIRPTGLAVMKDRAFAMSYDADGVNRLYEIKKDQGDDNRSKQIVSMYATRRMGGQAMQSSEFMEKKLLGGEIWISEVSKPIGVAIDFRPDSYHCWNDFMPERQFGTTNPISARTEKHFKVGSPDSDQCRDDGNDKTIGFGTEFQFLVRGRGNFRIDRMRIYANELQPIPIRIESNDCEPENVTNKAVACLTEDDFEYLIVEPNG